MSIPLGFNSITKFRRSEKHSPREARNMDLTGFRRLCDSDGKGMVGCIIFIVLIGTAIFLAITLVPLYYSNHHFESDVETEVSRAGAQFLKDETIINKILVIAKRYEIELTPEDIIVERFAGQVHVEVNYTVPVSFALFRRGLNFQITVSSFMGTP